MYKLIHGKQPVIRLADGKILGSDTAEFTEYLAWLAAGNTPEPADPPSAREKLATADAAAKTAAKADNVVRYLRDHTPAEVDTYILSAVSDLPPSAKQMFRKMGLMLCVLAKQSLR